VRRRLDGVDLARALAFAGMLLAHYVWPHGPGEPGWLLALDAGADGRAAPLFCVLLGLSAGLLVARGTPDSVLVRRGVGLFALGLLVWPFAGRVYLILPQYGVLLVAVPLLRRLSDRALLVTAAAAFVIPSAVAAVMENHHLRAGSQPVSYGELLDVGDIARTLLWTGAYPLVGWIGFVVIGLWLARRRLSERAVQLRLLTAGTAVVLTQPLLAAATVALAGDPRLEHAGGLATFFDGRAHSNRTAWYLLGTATALAVLALCLLVTTAAGAERWRPVRLPLVRLGEVALSAYLLHLLLGRLIVWNWNDDTKPAIVTQLAVVVLVVVAFAAGASLWRRRFRRGPVESALRALTG
jgi:uncharacterized membrane protein YeiB